MHLSLSALLLSILAVWAGSAAAQGSDPLGSRGNPVAVDIPDSLRIGGSPPNSPGDNGTAAFRVRGARVRAAASASAWRVTGGRVEATDSGGLTEVIRLLPAARPAVNSRGETVFSVRGSPERHVQVTLDGIPLNVPWDERADLSLIPTDALGAVSIDRGVTTALAIPGGLAGIVELSSRDLEEPGHRTRLAYQIGEVEATQARGLHVHRTEKWSFLVTASHRKRDAFLLPLGRELDMNQAGLQTRTNSDLKQTSFLVRASRELEKGRISVLAHASSGERGVPPESHTDAPRLWRIPDTSRTLVGLSAEVEPADRWKLHGVLAIDSFHQEIREFDDTTYTTPALGPGVDYETDDDRTVTARARAARQTDAGLWSVQGHVRATTHDESLVQGDPDLTYSQRITALAAEWNRTVAEDWLVRLGGGIEAASTPDSGDQPQADAQSAPVISGGVTRHFAWGQVEARASRKSRFPSLRELYSGALGRFVPNSELKPEDQNLVEVSTLRRFEKAEVAAGVFFARTEGLIERQVEDAQAGTFQRVNLDDARTLGLEISGTVQPAAGLRLALHHTILNVRADNGDGFVDPVEDRPDYLTQAVASYDHRSGARAQVEWIVTGARHSADVNDTHDGVARLGSQAQLNLRLAYRYFSTLSHLAHIEVFARVDNIADADLDSQFGLPDPGRMITAGARVLLD